MTHLHIRVPTKTRLHELKMAWFFVTVQVRFLTTILNLYYSTKFVLKQITFLNMTLILCFDLRVWEEIY